MRPLNNDTFRMYCMKCGAEDKNVSVSNTDPRCRKCGGKLDFAPVEKKVEK